LQAGGPIGIDAGRDLQKERRGHDEQDRHQREGDPRTAPNRYANRNPMISGAAKTARNAIGFDIQKSTSP
jgi:hypothetical protein